MHRISSPKGRTALFLIDQHAAHGSASCTNSSGAQTNHTIASQGLVAGQRFHLTPAQATLLEVQIEAVGGFGIPNRGRLVPNIFMIRAIPACGAHRSGKAVLSVVEELEQDAQPLQETMKPRSSSVCANGVGEAGATTLSGQEMERWCVEFGSVRQSSTPVRHGRPTMIHLSVAQLAREFGRM